LLIFSTLLAACSGSTGPGGSNGGRGPGIGSNFNFIMSETDEIGNPVATDVSLSQSVTGNNLTLGGKSGVVSQSSSSGDVQYWSYETNGDVGLYNVVTEDGIPVHSFWVELPFVSQTVKDYAWDSIWQGTNHMDTVEFSYHITYIGEGSITVGGKAFPTHRAQSVLHLHSNATLYQLADVVQTIDYSPDLKQFAQHIENQTTTDDFFGTRSDIYTTTMVGYTLK